MITKSQLEKRITELQSELNSFKDQLQNYPEITLENSKLGDTLSDGTVVIFKEGNRVLIAAPEETEVRCKWTPEFTEVFESLKSHGLIPSQWHVPTIEELELACTNARNSFFFVHYWSSEEFTSTWGYFLTFSTDTLCLPNTLHKKHINCVRAFRWVTV